MTNQTISKVLIKIKNENQNFSLGFKRYIHLPQRIRSNINTACVLNKHNSPHDYFIPFIEKLTEQEFILWMKIQ